MKRTICWVIVLAASCGSARADSWIFRRSFYSHDPVTHVRIGKQFSRGPVFTRPEGEYVRTGYRNLHSTIQAGGTTYDHVNLWESWIQTGAQY